MFRQNEDQANLRALSYLLGLSFPFKSFKFAEFALCVLICILLNNGLCFATCFGTGACRQEKTKVYAIMRPHKDMASSVLQSVIGVFVFPLQNWSQKFTWHQNLCKTFLSCHCGPRFWLQFGLSNFCRLLSNALARSIRVVKQIRNPHPPPPVQHSMKVEIFTERQQ